MRKDVAIYIKYTKEGEIMNKSEVSRRFNCDWRTVDKYINGAEPKRKPREYKTKLDDFKGIIIEKVDNYTASSMAVYNFLLKKGYTGGYLTVNNFVKKHKDNEINKATFRFETTPGLQAQVDWKEKITMINRKEEKFEINIFLIILGYSRLKYLKLTDNRNQKTLFKCMYSAFEYFEGIPKEILFDNMKTVVDRSKSTFKNVVLNSKFKSFSKDAGFEVITCRPYRPCTKGKVEVVAKLVDRLKVYNKEFDTFEDLDKIVKNFNTEINNEIQQTTREIPFNRFKKEKEYLNPFSTDDCLKSYFYQEKDYKVSKESMVNYKGKKYSVPTRFIGFYLNISETEDRINIYYTKDLVSSHPKSDKYLNYKVKHAVEILKSDAFSHMSEDNIEKYIENNLERMDIFLS
jgi:transposase